MQAGAEVADLRAGHQRHAVMEAGGRGRTAGALRHVLVDLAVLVGAGAEALHRGHDHARVERVDVLPGESHAVERAGREVLDQHVAGLHQALQHLHALLALGVERDRALVVVEHGEIEAVGARHVLQLAARDVAGARPLDLDHVGAEPGQQLRAGRARLDVREIEDLHAVQRLAVLAPGLGRDLGQAVAVRLLGHDLEDGFFAALAFLEALSFFAFLSFFFAMFVSDRLNVVDAARIYFLRSLLCGLRLPMRPLSLPAAGSITALIRVGLPKSIAAFTARLRSSGVVALTPVPPKASIILS